MHREFFEEVLREYMVDFYRSFENPDKSRGERWITKCFFGFTDDLPTDWNPLEVADVGFFSREQIEEMDIAFDNKEIILSYFEERTTAFNSITIAAAFPI